MKKKMLYSALLILALVGACKNPFFPAKKGGDTSAEIPTVTISAAPVNPYILDEEVAITANAVVNGGGALSYQWYSNVQDSNEGGTQVGANNASYAPSTAAAGTTYYYVVVTNTLNGTTATATSNTVQVTVYDIGQSTAIRSVALAITGPVKGGLPATMATTDDSGYTCTTVSWDPNDNPFEGGVVYTVTVTLTAEANHTFTALRTAAINGQPATVTNNGGDTLTLSYTFAETDTRTVSGIAIASQPTKLEYIHGDTLDLAGLAIQLTFADAAPEVVALGSFVSRNISTVPANGAVLSHTEHDGQPVVVSYSGLTANTDNLSVNCRIIFNTNEGSSIPDQGVASGGMVSRPPNPSKSGYVFDLWYADAGFAVPYNFTAAITSDTTTLYARWVSQAVIDDIADNLVPVSGTGVSTFLMGKNLGTGGGSDVTPVHTVTFTQGFSMSKYQVTQEQYEAVMGTNPSYFHGGSGREPAEGETQNRRPVETVSWYDAIEFCNKLSELAGLTPYYTIDKTTSDPNNTNASDSYKWLITPNTSADGYRLPTEAQWEYAAKGGNTGEAFTYSGSDDPDAVAWYTSNSGSKTHEVGKKAPNGLGLYDMSGNVYEWCWDWYGAYPATEVEPDPLGASSGSSRAVRGGGWLYSAQNVRSAHRAYDNPYNRFIFVGFRVVRP